MLLHIPGNISMKDFGVIGFITTIVSYMISRVLNLLHFFGRLSVDTLQEIALYVSIIVGIMTILWYAGNMIIKQEEFTKALKLRFKKWRGK